MLAQAVLLLSDLDISYTDCDSLHNCFTKEHHCHRCPYTVVVSILHTLIQLIGYLISEVRLRLHGCLSEGTRGHTNTQLVITRHIGYHWHTPFGISEALQYLWH